MTDKTELVSALRGAIENMEWAIKYSGFTGWVRNSTFRKNLKAYKQALSEHEQSATVDDIDSRSWKSDFKYENGKYHCQCIKCKEIFIGYKRRAICKVCTPTPEPTADIAEGRRLAYDDILALTGRTFSDRRIADREYGNTLIQHSNVILEALQDGVRND